jgi:hypothetical protein
MSFLLVCGVITISGFGHTIEIKGHSALLPSQQLEFQARKPLTYALGQTQVIISKDHKTMWLNTDTDDRPGRGDKYRCTLT